MKKYYFILLLLLLFFVPKNFAQQSAQTLVADKAWLNEDEEWTDFQYSGQIVFSINPNSEEGSFNVINYDFLLDLSAGKPKFSNKATYNSAEFLRPVKMQVKTDKQGVVNSTYEGALVFKSEKDFYSIPTIVTILAKGSTLIGVKMHLKDDNRKEYAFSLKEKS